MATEILVPPFSQTMDSLVFLAWLKKVGDPVEKGEILYQVETDKAALEVESPASGVLIEILAEPGNEVLVKSKIGVIASPEEYYSTQPVPLPPDRQPRIFASPRARNLAKTEGVPLSEVKPTGPKSIIVERDIRAYLETHKVNSKAQPLQTVTPVSLSGKGRPVALTALRKTIARRMQQSHQNSAPVTITREVDATELVKLRASILNELPVGQLRPTYTDFFIMILARALPQHPNLNSHFKDDVLEVFDEINIGLAVESDRGLVVPVIHNVAGKGLLYLASERSHLIQRALEGNLSHEELGGGTFTLTNLGPLGVDGFTPLINPPQVAILGIGRIRSIPAVFEEQISIRQVLVLSLTFDHRVVDGAPAARFLHEVAQWVEKPSRIWL